MIDFNQLHLQGIAERKIEDYETDFPKIQELVDNLNKSIKEKGIDKINFKISYNIIDFKRSTEVNYVTITGVLSDVADKSYPLIKINKPIGKVTLNWEMGWNSKEKIIVGLEKDYDLKKNFNKFKDSLLAKGWNEKIKFEDWKNGEGHNVYHLTKQFDSVNFSTFFNDFVEDLKIFQKYEYIQRKFKSFKEKINATQNSNKEESSYFTKNLILYGPPGTGKTFITKQKAVEVIEK